MKRPFVAPRLVGARFDDHTIPLELLKDLAALEEFVVAVAKWKFVQQHGRVRTPKEPLIYSKTQLLPPDKSRPPERCRDEKSNKSAPP